MQTFLLDTNHKVTAKFLDYKRLGKQRLECTQLMDVLLRKAGLLIDDKKGWNNHVAVDYWYTPALETFEITSKGRFPHITPAKNYLPALIDYTNIMIKEWVKRGYNNTLETSKWENLVKANPSLFEDSGSKPPWQVDAIPVIQSHRARVLQKDFDFYSKVFIENAIPFPENWATMEYKWMRLTDKQFKELKNNQLVATGVHLYRTE